MKFFILSTLGAKWRLHHGGGKNVIMLTVNIECCRTECVEVNGRCEVTSRITNGESILGMELDIDELNNCGGAAVQLASKE
jgi:hypothetical protein